MLIVGNWKMNGDLAANARLLNALLEVGDPPCEMAVCAPHVYLSPCAQQRRIDHGESHAQIAAKLNCSLWAQRARPSSTAAA
ncbi:triose-phosphate isomerase [Duganella sp. BuS-21]|uniref:triose-phosphate isomerase n=1 Tax=Duganella sp. BuS-21 TaxID=2943848 RepID=UPI0035A686D2